MVTLVGNPRLVDPESRDLVPALCAEWHDPTVEPVDRTPVSSDVPTLLLSGQFDPITPPWLAELAAETLRRSHSFVVPMAGHGVGMDTACGRKLVQTFLDTPGRDPSPACSPNAELKRSEFRTIYLKKAVRSPVFAMSYHGTLPGKMLTLGVLLILAAHVSALILWPAGVAIRRLRSGVETAPRAVDHPRLTAAAIIAVSAGFSLSTRAALDVLFAFWEMAPSLAKSLSGPWMLSVVTGERDWWLADEVVRSFGFYPWARALFVIPYLTAGATMYVLYLAWRSWREKWWTGLGRVHYSIVAITLAWYPFHLFASGYIL